VAGFGDLELLTPYLPLFGWQLNGSPIVESDLNGAVFAEFRARDAGRLSCTHDGQNNNAGDSREQHH